MNQSNSILYKNAPSAVFFSMLAILCALVFSISACIEDPEPVADGPYIESLQLVDGKLKIEGDFGADPGADNRAVIVNTQTLPASEVFTWGESNIECIFEHPVTEDLAVTVVSNHKRSNTKILNVTSNLKITWLQVWEDSSKLFLYGNFGADPGPVVRSVKVKGVPVQSVQMWSPSLIICKIPRIEAGSYGEVVVQRGPNESTSRNLYKWRIPLDYTFPQGGLGGSIYEAATFHVVVRGDIGAIPEGVVPYERQQLYLFSYCDYKMAGSGHSTYDEGCNTVDVVWPEVYGTVGVTPNTEYAVGRTHFYGYLTAKDNGYELEMAMDVWNATQSTITISSCHGGPPSVTTFGQMIDFVPFDHEKIPLVLAGKTILSISQKKYQVAPTCGLIWDAADYPANLVTVTLESLVPTIGEL